MSWLFRPRGIVIDDYEGHSRYWKAHFFEDGSVAIGGVCKLFTKEVGQRTRKRIKANALLIQDAPKLLAEIKRLRSACPAGECCLHQTLSTTAFLEHWLGRNPYVILAWHLGDPSGNEALTIFSLRRFCRALQGQGEGHAGVPMTRTSI